MTRISEISGKEQLTLGGLIDRLKVAIRDSREGDASSVYFSLDGIYPKCFDSWRGSYQDLALLYSDSPEIENAKDVLAMCEHQNGATHTGYKGGEFTMDLDTPIWVVPHYSSSAKNVLVDVVYDAPNDVIRLVLDRCNF